MPTTMHEGAAAAAAREAVTITIAGAEIHATLAVPGDARGLVVFAHSSGVSRASPRNHALSRMLNDAALATLVCDLLTGEEEILNEITGEFRFDVKLASQRLTAVVDWCATRPALARLPVGIFGAGTGAAAAVMTASARRGIVRALVLRGGRLDLAWNCLPLIDVPTLLVAGELDAPIRASYSVALPRLATSVRELVVVPRAGHLFLEPNAIEQLGEHAARWFDEHLGVYAGAPEGWLAEVC